jgi:hypothetical protein
LAAKDSVLDRETVEHVEQRDHVQCVASNRLEFVEVYVVSERGSGRLRRSAVGAIERHRCVLSGRVVREET